MKIKDFLCGIFRCGNKKPTLSLVVNRDAGNRAAIIFVHGFCGDAKSTWSSFLDLLLADTRLKDWDVYSAGYSTNLSLDLPIWTADPDIKVCATGLTTKLRVAPLDRYKAITLVAHSMGGLVVQRTILDSAELRDQRLSHVVLYGTPSNGLLKAKGGARLKKQARDMQVGGDFITQLREEWPDTIGENPPFTFTAIAGETDAFVPALSSIDPFPKSQQAAVPGNHLEIVRPDSTANPSYSLLYKTLTGSRGANTDVESARLAVELKEFDSAIKLLLHGADGLDANAIVILALALESVGRTDEAMEVLERWHQANNTNSLDSIGVLAGRLKRRWLLFRQKKDLDRALELYSAGLYRAESDENHDQAYYHAINVAFLRLMSEASTGPASSGVVDMAKQAIKHVEAAHENHWSHATKGEALLMLGDLDGGIESYRKARKSAKHLRECDSMHMQGAAVAGRVYGENGARQIDEVFGFDTGEPI